MLAIRLPEDIELRLTTLANKTGRTKTFYARTAILEYLDDLEDLYLAEKRLNNITDGKTKTIKLHQLERELGLAPAAKKELGKLDPQIAKQILQL
ncbi:type II toxin-antitoxin system RelB family antitoxin [Polynucleobacter kasalickyi]|uniref:Relaxosome protein TraY n=1 Tax=Polynucleobacter kasalickyi TaxID=1938817 RepID=A0A1W2BVZ2_9BURK|nr:RHH-type transcriptional regulator, rel operon repressor / antitoxin RelB [Polynucleobacter kasalickyi]